MPRAIPGPFLIVGFGSRLARLNSVFGRLGNCRPIHRLINDLGAAIRSLEGAKSGFCQFLPVDQGQAGQPARRYWTASSRRKR